MSSKLVLPKSKVPLTNDLPGKRTPISEFSSWTKEIYIPNLDQTFL